MANINQYIAARDKWKPEKVNVLIIAESPPAGGGYFYFNEPRRSGLFAETIKALGIVQELPKGYDKHPLLEQFKCQGYLLLDCCYEPVNKMPLKERKQTINNQLGRLVKDVQTIDPQKIIIIKSSIYYLVKNALEKSGYGNKVLNQKPIPFPSHGHQATYRQSIKELMLTK